MKLFFLIGIIGFLGLFSTTTVSGTPETARISGIHNYTTGTGQNNQKIIKFGNKCDTEHGVIKIVKTCTWLASSWVDSSNNVIVGRGDKQVEVANIVLEIIFISLLFIASLYSFYLHTKKKDDPVKANLCLDFARFLLCLSVAVATLIWWSYDHSVLIPSIVISLILLTIVLRNYQEEPPRENEDTEVAH